MSRSDRALFDAMTRVVTDAYHLVESEITDPDVIGLLTTLRDDHLERIQREHRVVKQIDEQQIRQASLAERAGL